MIWLQHPICLTKATDKHCGNYHHHHDTPSHSHIMQGRPDSPPNFCQAQSSVFLSGWPIRQFFLSWTLSQCLIWDRAVTTWVDILNTVIFLFLWIIFVSLNFSFGFLSSWFRASLFSINENPSRCNSVQIFIYCKSHSTCFVCHSTHHQEY